MQARQSKHCIGGSTSREREREGGERERDVCVCVLFESRQSVFFSSVEKFCVDLCKKI